MSNPCRPPVLHLVIDPHGWPARYGVSAALLAQALTSEGESDVGFGHLPFHFDTSRHADAVQHVAPTGPLLPSGLLWYERLSGLPAPQPRSLRHWIDAWFGDRVNAAGAPLPHAAVRDTETPREVATTVAAVLAIHPGINVAAVALPTLLAEARTAMLRIGGAVRCYRTIESQRAGSVQLSLACLCVDDVIHEAAYEAAFKAAYKAVHEAVDSRTAATSPPRWLPWVGRQDRFGRWHAARPETETSAPSTGFPAAPAARAVTVALIGLEAEQFAGYPGTLAALGDAADHLGMTLDLQFISPYDASAVVAALDDTLSEPSPSASSQTTLPSRATRRVRGMLLPGGADMRRVAGQIAAADFGWQRRIPTLGLCLGMQTMATAAMQRASGRTDITLLELAPETALPSFVRNADDAHRLGLHGVRPVMTENAEREIDVDIGEAIRCNHRFRLNPALFETLSKAQVDIVAWDESGTIVDAIAASPEARQPFYAGAQGHPELMSSPGTPHPMIVSWLRAVRDAQDRV